MKLELVETPAPAAAAVKEHPLSRWKVDFDDGSGESAADALRQAVGTGVVTPKPVVAAPAHIVAATPTATPPAVATEALDEGKGLQGKQDDTGDSIGREIKQWKTDVAEISRGGVRANAQRAAQYGRFTRCLKPCHKEPVLSHVAGQMLEMKQICGLLAMPRATASGRKLSSWRSSPAPKRRRMKKPTCGSRARRRAT